MVHVVVGPMIAKRRRRRSGVVRCNKDDDDEDEDDELVIYSGRRHPISVDLRATPLDVGVAEKKPGRSFAFRGFQQAIVVKRRHFRDFSHLRRRAGRRLLVR